MSKQMEKAAADLARAMEGAKNSIGKQLAPAMQRLVADLVRVQARPPTRLERLALWLMRCPAVPWRRTRSPDGKVVGHRHGLVTGWIVALGEWLWDRSP